MVWLRTKQTSKADRSRFIFGDHSHIKPNQEFGSASNKTKSSEQHPTITSLEQHPIIRPNQEFGTAVTLKFRLARARASKRTRGMQLSVGYWPITVLGSEVGLRIGQGHHRAQDQRHDAAASEEALAIASKPAGVLCVCLHT